MPEHHVARAVGMTTATTPPYVVDVRIGRHRLRADEPAAAGGGDVGPAPFGLLLAALSACTATTLRMYAERKGWDLVGVAVDARYEKDDDGPARIQRRIDVSGALDAGQQQRLAEIADRTPVTRAVSAGTSIHTTLIATRREEQ
jgi:uncharacterized OsmC-like protein